MRCPTYHTRHLFNPFPCRLKQATIRLLEERLGIAEPLEPEPEPEPARVIFEEVKAAEERDAPLFPEEYDSIDANIRFMQGRMAGYV